MIVPYQVTFTVKLEISGEILSFIAKMGEIADMTQTVLPDGYVRTDLTLLTFVP